MEQGLQEEVGNIRAQWSCQRHGKLIVAGLTDYVSNVATVFDKDPNLLIVEVALAHDICPNGSIRVAVAAWGKNVPLGRRIVQGLGVRILAGEFHEDVREVLARERQSCKINLVAWKPWRISKTSWAISTSMMFVLGAIGKNQILWDRPDQWEGLPSFAHELSSPTQFVVETMGIDLEMMGEYPADNNDWHELKHLLSTNFARPPRDKDVSYDWPWLWRISQQLAGFIPIHSQMMVISAKLERT